MLTVSVLGPVEVRRDGVRLDVPAGKTTEVLARLALAEGAQVRADALIEDLWAEPTSRNTLQSKVSQLRRALGDREAVVALGDNYALVVDHVDTTHLIALAASTASAIAESDWATAAEQSRAALSMFRGDVLIEAGDWAAPHRARLEEVRLGLLEQSFAARIGLGAGLELVADLETLVAQNPVREGLWASLITALFRAGRQAEALAAYARLRTALVDELGIDPSPALQQLEQQVLRHGVDLAGSARSVTVPGNVADPGPPLIGRDADLALVADSLRERRLVTVVGPAGVGKTRLALQVSAGLINGDRAPAGGVWLVRLDALEAGRSMAEVLRAVAEILHVRATREALQERLSGAGTVLVLDNCEHLVGAVAELLTWLFESVPTLRVLASSQVAIGVEQELVHKLGPLSGEDSVALFTRRAQELRSSFALDADTTASVEEVCRSLDGLPLAIELAAARVRSLSVLDIARRLDDRFTLLRDPSSHRPERRRALEGAISWSYDLLFPDDQRGLWALSCFAGSASLAATETVVRALGVPVGVVLDTVTRLVDRSLVSVDSAEGGEVRYRLLDSIRAFAADRLVESGQEAVARAAHAQWYAEAAAWCDEHVRTGRQSDTLRLARAERANVDAALAWCAANDSVLGLRIATGFGWTWVVLGDGPAGAARVRGALTPVADPSDRAVGHLLAGWLEASAGDVALAQDDLDSASVLAGQTEDEVLVADVLRHTAFLAVQQGRPDVVLASAGISLATYEARGLVWSMAGSLLLAAFGSLMVGDTVAAAREARTAVDLLTPIGDSWGLVHGQAMLAGIAQAEGRYDEAASALDEAADKSRSLGFLGQSALHRASLARVRHRSGDDAAAVTYEQAIAEALAVGDGRLASTARLNLARLLWRQGETGRAESLLSENKHWYGASGGGDFALLNEAVLAALREDLHACEAVLEKARATGDLEPQVYALDALGRRAEADGLAAQLMHVLDPADREGVSR